MSNLKAFAIQWSGLPDVIALYAAETASKARYLAWITINEMWGNPKFVELRCLRAPDYDDVALSFEKPKNIGENYLDSSKALPCFRE